MNNTPIVTLGYTCTPGYTFSHGYSKDTNSTDIFPPNIQLALSRGYAVIVPDHTGARLAYAEPYVGGHVVLDSIRAAAALDPKEFGKGPVAMPTATPVVPSPPTARRNSPPGRSRPDRSPRRAAIGGVPADFGRWPGR